MLTPAFETRCFDLQILPKYSQEILDDVSLDEYNATVAVITQLSKKLNLSLKL